MTSDEMDAERKAGREVTIILPYWWSSRWADAYAVDLSGTDYAPTKNITIGCLSRLILRSSGVQSV